MALGCSFMRAMKRRVAIGDDRHPGLPFVLTLRGETKAIGGDEMTITDRIRQTTHQREIDHNSRLQRLTAATLGGLITLIAGGCGLQANGTGAGGVAGVLASLEPLTKNCDGPLNGYAALELSAPGRSNPHLQSARLLEVHDMADQVAACGGSLKAVAFSSSAVETFTLGEEEFPTSSGTETARLIQANHAVNALMSSVTANMPAAMHRLSPNGTDVLAQLTLAHQDQQQRQTGKLYVQLETSGVTTTGPVVMSGLTFTDQAARIAVRQVQVPDLSGATVRIVGVGKVAVPGSRQSATSRTAAVTDFYSIACRRTHAHCLVTTDYTPGG